MSHEDFQLYKEKEKELFLIRERSSNEDSLEEQQHLNSMDNIWYRLTEEERKQMDTGELNEVINGISMQMDAALGWWIDMPLPVNRLARLQPHPAQRHRQRLIIEQFEIRS